MAGSYPDVPGHRMAYDRDGTILMNIPHPGTSGTPVLQTTAVMQQFNDDYEMTKKVSTWNTQGWAFIFPELRDITGLFLAKNADNGATVDTSVDTTNGVDGTWVARGSFIHAIESSFIISPMYRSSVTAYNYPGIKAIRFRFSSGSGHNYGMMHIYGQAAAGLAPNRLKVWHPTLDTPVGGAYFDWGDVAQSTSADRQFRVKNPSATLTANSISLTREALTPLTPSIVTQHQFSLDGSTFADTVNIGSLAPGAISVPITLRRTIISGAALSTSALRIVASAASYS